MGQRPEPRPFRPSIASVDGHNEIRESVNEASEMEEKPPTSLSKQAEQFEKGDRRFSFLSLPLKVLFGGKILWTACVVIFPYIFAELRP